jgi:hypothetical protein
MKRKVCIALGLCLPLTGWAATPLEGSRAVDPDVAVEIGNVRGEIIVEASDRAEVVLDGSLGEGSRLVFDGDRRRVQVKIETESGSGWSWWGRGGPSEDTRLIVRVPKAASLDVSAVSAEVEVRGYEGSGQVEVGSVSGDVRVEGRSERLSLSTVSGEITARGGARRADLESVSGDIDARDLAGDAEVETVSGDIRISIRELREVGASSVSGDVEIDVDSGTAPRITVETMSGGIALRLPASVDARLEAETFSGDITSDFGTVAREEHGSGSRLDTRAGAGNGRVRLESFSGDIRLQRAPE